MLMTLYDYIGETIHEDIRDANKEQEILDKIIDSLKQGYRLVAMWIYKDWSDKIPESEMPENRICGFFQYSYEKNNDAIDGIRREISINEEDRVAFLEECNGGVRRNKVTMDAMRKLLYNSLVPKEDRIYPYEIPKMSDDYANKEDEFDDADMYDKNADAFDYTVFENEYWLLWYVSPTEPDRIVLAEPDTEQEEIDEFVLHWGERYPQYHVG